MTLAANALALWGLEDAQCDFVAGRENQVFRVVSGRGRFALRIKRPGYRSTQELQSELDWMAQMRRAGLQVPEPLPSVAGRLLEPVGGHLVDVVTWLDGRPMGKTREPLDLPNAPATFRALGREMAKLHAASDAWATPTTFKRCAWDADGLLGEDPLWGRFWENPTLEGDTKRLLDDFRRLARRELARVDLEQGLIHADLVRENVMLDGDRIAMIDFDDGGFGYRIFDVATALLKNRSEPNYSELQGALIEGYRSQRPLDTAQLDLFLALRAVTYLGWIIPRMSEPGSAARNAYFMQDAEALCRAYLQRELEE